MKNLIICLILLPLLSSCGTMFMGSQRDVLIQSNVVDPVNLVVDGQRFHNVTLPYRMKLKKTTNYYEIRVSAEGYEPRTVYLGKTVNNMIFLNFLNLGLGFLVDLAAGTFEVPEQNYLDIELRPASSQE